MCGPGPCTAPVPCGRCERREPRLDAKGFEREAMPPIARVSDVQRTSRTLAVISTADQQV